MHLLSCRGWIANALTAVSLHAAASLSLHAQDADPSSSLPITVGVEPGNSLPGGKIRISGSTIKLANAPGLNANSMTVRITITPMGQFPVDAETTVSATTEYEQPRTYTVPVNAAGGYAGIFDGPTGHGHYRVIAFAPDGKGRDTTDFVVIQREDMEDEVTERFKRAIELAGTAVENADRMIESLPESPAKVEVTKRLTAIKSKMAQGPSQTAAFASGIDLITSIPEKYPETTPAFAPFYRRMGLWTANSREEIETISKELDKSKKARVTCDQLDRVIESLKFASMLLNLVGSPMEVAKNFAGDLTSEVIVKQASASPRLSSDQNFQTMVGQVNKKVPDIFGKIEEWKGGGSLVEKTANGQKVMRREIDLQGSATGLLADAAQYAAGKVFDSYCEKFEGPLKASMNAEFTKGGTPWWKYSVDIEGKLVLRYAKGATGAAASVSGQFEGAGRSFKVWENAGQVLFPELMPKGAIVARVIKPPIGSPYIQTEGMVAAQVLTPTSFLIPVEGTIVGKKLTLRMLASTIDFTTATARGVYVFFGPGTLGIPLTTTFTLPYKDAHWILEKGLGGTQTEFEIKTAGKKMTIERTSKVDKPGSASAKYTMDLQACNPGC